MSRPEKHVEAIPIGVALPRSMVHVQGQPVQVSVLGQAVAAPAAASAGARRDPGCDCSVPSDAGPEVRVARSWSAAVIFVHVFALLAFGATNLFQVVGSLCGIVAGGVLLCCFQRDIYMCTPFTFFSCVTFDLIAATVWVLRGFMAVAIFPVVAALVTAAAIFYVSRASASWDASAGATMNAHPAPRQAAIVVAQGTTRATMVQHAPQYDRTPTVYV